MTLWTTTRLPSLSGPTALVYFCDYGPALLERWSLDRALLRGQLGGGLGLDRVEEVGFGAPNPAQVAAEWERLTLAPPVEPFLWRIGLGPALRLFSKSHYVLRPLVLRVTSLEHARHFLRDCGLLDERNGPEPRLAAQAAQGLDIRLVE